jgi:thiol-disulfide isomerase/thioredoxin
MMSLLFRIIILFVSFNCAGQETQFCSLDSVELEMNRRQKAFKEMYNSQHEIANLDLNGNFLYDFKSRKSLIVFWKTDCPYCKNLLEVIGEILNETSPQDIQVVAVCLDSDTLAWQNHEFVKRSNANLLNLCDGKGYYGNIPSQLNVFATPTMIILDENHCFKKLPKGIEELKKILKNEE